MVELALKINEGDLRRRIANSGCCQRCIERIEPYVDLACAEDEKEEDGDGVQSRGHTEDAEGQVVDEERPLCMEAKNDNGVNGATAAEEESSAHDVKVKLTKRRIGREKPQHNGDGGDVHHQFEIDALPDGSSPCFVCLGILGHRQLRKVTGFVTDEIKHANYESPHFFLSLVTIQILEIRQILLALWLKAEFASLSLTTFMDYVTPLKQVLKDDLTSLLPEMLGLQYRNDSAFDVKLEIDVKNEAEFFGTLERLDPDAFVMRTKRQQRAKKTTSQIFSRKSVLEFFAKQSTDSLKNHFPFPMSAGNEAERDSKKEDCRVGCNRIDVDGTRINDSIDGVDEPFLYRLTMEHEPIFIGGRYNKYSRDLPQTPWIVEGERLKESSIEELIVGPVKKALIADDFKFSSSGREDIDVRCLGDGRPFVVECINPRRTRLTEDELKQVEDAINSSADANDKVRVGNLAMVSERETAYLRKMENEKNKHYVAECHSAERLTEGDMDKLKAVNDLLVQQKTPIRVLHRRPLAVRPRRIYSIFSAELVDDHHFRIGLETEAGTYIKEFVHGDLGRTQPNLKEILSKDVDILKLDVEKVDVVWPLPAGFNVEEALAAAATTGKSGTPDDFSDSGDERDS